jgi:phosphoglycerate dehydrogenase-like enzyme
VRICVLDDLEAAALSAADWTPVTTRGELTVVNRHVDDEDELVELLQPFDVVVAMRERTAFRRSLLARLPALRLLVTTGARNAAIDLATCAERGVVVSGTTGGGSPVVELAWALFLATVRDLPSRVGSMAAGEWQPTVGSELAGRTLGLVGLGHTGARMARIGSAFGMEVLAWSPNLTSERAAEHGATAVDKDALFRRSDVVSLHLVLSDRTRGIVGEPELSAMRPTSWLVNTSRGPLCDEPALLRACAAGWIAGVALDVYAAEPLPAEHPLRSEPRALLTPHVGYVTWESYRRWYGDVVEDIVSFAGGAPLRVLNG